METIQDTHTRVAEGQVMPREMVTITAEITPVQIEKVPLKNWIGFTGSPYHDLRIRFVRRPNGGEISPFEKVEYKIPAGRTLILQAVHPGGFNYEVVILQKVRQDNYWPCIGVCDPETDPNCSPA